MSVQSPQSTMIPEKVLANARARTQAGAQAELESLLWFRENIDEWKQEKVLMIAYREYSEAMMCSPETLRRKMWVIRDYAPNFLERLIEHGIWLEHIENANSLAEVAKKTPMQLLNECIDLGNENGKPMTVNEMITFALGEKVRHPFLAKVNPLLERLMKFPRILKWDENKTAEFTRWLEVGRELFFR